MLTYILYPVFFGFAFLILSELSTYIIKLFAYPCNAFLRFKPVCASIGVFTYFLCLVLLILIATARDPQSYTLFLDSIHTVLIQVSSGQRIILSDLLEGIWKPQSIVFAGFIYLYAIAGAVQLFAAFFFDLTDKDNPITQGSSICYLLCKKKFPGFNENFYKAIVEPVLVFATAVFLIEFDVMLGIFLIIGAIALFGQGVEQLLFPRSFNDLKQQFLIKHG